MNNQEYPEYEEISIKELIQTLIDGKNLIIGITVIAVILASVFTFFIQKPIYESKTTLLATNVSDEVVSEENFENIEELINNLNLQTANTLETYRQQVTSYEIINSVIDKLELDRERYSINGLRNMINVSVIENTNLIEIKVESTDPELSSKIANAVSKEFVAFINDINEEKINRSASFVKVKIEDEKDNLAGALTSLEQFLEEHDSTEVLEKEIEASVEKLSNDKTELENLKTEYEKKKLNNELQIDRIENELAKSKEILDLLDEKVVTNSTVINNDLLREYFQETGMDVGDLSKVNISEEVINENYYILQDKVNNLEIQLSNLVNERKVIEKEYNSKKEILEETIASTEEKIEESKIKLAKLENEEQLIRNEIDRSKNTYQLLSNKFEEIKISQSVKAGEMNIMVNSLAYPNDNPVSPNKLLNLAIAVVLGLMIGVFTVFLKKAWESEE